MVSAVGKATRIEFEDPCPDGLQLSLTEHFLPAYEAFNPQQFPSGIAIDSELMSCICLADKAFAQSHAPFSVQCFQHMHLSANNSKDVLLAFSAGLDSVFQALRLQAQGYVPHLFFMRGANTYENGQAFKHAEAIANKLNLELIAPKMVKSFKKDNMFRQSWPENPLKNQLIYATMIDYCNSKGWNMISAGDDFNLSIKDAVPGINLTDAYELTEAFIKGAKQLCINLKFIPIEKGHEKLERIKALIDAGLQDDYYSCVQSGRFNQSYHRRAEETYGVDLFQNSCGCYCRKCAMHCLLLHYGDVKKFPAKFISKCWNKMWNNAHSADYAFFSPDLTEAQRVKNLFEY